MWCFPVTLTSYRHRKLVSQLRSPPASQTAGRVSRVRTLHDPDNKFPSQKTAPEREKLDKNRQLTVPEIFSILLKAEFVRLRNPASEPLGITDSHQVFDVIIFHVQCVSHPETIRSHIHLLIN